MTDQLLLGLPPGGDGQQPKRNPEPDGDWAGRDWFHLVILEWMWHEDGLALRPGAELMVYATVYRASAHGGGAYVATNASMGELLGYPRETVNRVVGRLIDAGLIWPVWRIQGNHGGRPVKCYAVCQPAIERAQRRMAAHQLKSGLAAGEPANRDTDDNQSIAGNGTNVTDRHIETDDGFQHCVTERHIEDVDNPHHNVTKHPIGPPQCDMTSHSQCDETSHVTKHHIGKYGASPADTSLFNIPHISTYHISTDQGGEVPVENRGPTPQKAHDAPDHPLTADELTAFRALVGKSLRPVDDAYVGRCQHEFARLLSEGVSADIVLTAYDEYAAYQRRRRSETGESRAMHLLNWLAQRPNTNIQYVVNRLGMDRQLCKAGGDGRNAPVERHRGPRPSHERPVLQPCRDNGRALWIVTDERGTRIVEKSEGVESQDAAIALYQAMYESELCV